MLAWSGEIRLLPDDPPLLRVDRSTQEIYRLDLQYRLPVNCRCITASRSGSRNLESPSRWGCRRTAPLLLPLEICCNCLKRKPQSWWSRWDCFGLFEENLRKTAKYTI